MVPEHPQENAPSDWWSTPCSWEKERSSSPHGAADKEAHQNSESISRPHRRGEAERMSSERHSGLPDERSTMTTHGDSKFPRGNQRDGSRYKPETAAAERAVDSRNVEEAGVTAETPSAKVESEAPRSTSHLPLSRGSRTGGGSENLDGQAEVARDTRREGRSCRRKRSKRRSRRSEVRGIGKRDDHLRLPIGGRGTAEGGSETINWRSRLQQPRDTAIPRRPTEHQDWLPPVGRPSAVPRRVASISDHLRIDDYDRARGGGEPEGRPAVVLSPAGRSRRSRSRGSIARRRAADCDQDFTNAEQSESIDGSPIGDAEGLCDATVEPRGRDKRRRSRRCISASFDRHLQREATKPLEGIKVELLTSEEARRGAIDQHRELRLSSTLRRRESSSTDTTPTATPRVVKLGSAGQVGAVVVVVAIGTMVIVRTGSKVVNNATGPSKAGVMAITARAAVVGTEMTATVVVAAGRVEEGMVREEVMVEEKDMVEIDTTTCRGSGEGILRLISALLRNWDAGIDWNYEKLTPFNKDFYVPHPTVEGRSEGEVDDIRRANKIQLIKADGLKVSLRYSYHLLASTLDTFQCPKPVTTFEESNFPDYLISTLNQRFPGGRPSAIQMQGWPVASSGRDLVGVAETGSGKTLAYLMPAIVHIAAQPEVEQGDGPVALVLVPTRELSQQVNTEAKLLAQSMLETGSVPLRIACVYGGQPKRVQGKELWTAPELLVATPGRLIDFLQNGATNLKRVTYLVIDEADEMLALGFGRQLDSICSAIRPDRQTLMWSATWPKEIQDLARKHCREMPVHINIARQVTQDFVFLEHPGMKQKEFMDRVIPKVWNVLESNGEAKALIFCNTKREVDQLTQMLRSQGYNAVCIHSDKEQSEREWVFAQYRDGDVRLLVATNLMGRGVDIKNIQFVINYDMPQSIEEYVHRIGRTARAGARGTSITLFTAQEGRHAQDLVDILNEAGQNVPEFLSMLKDNPYWRPGF
ncbi:hypothetical protein FOZ62_000531 [Perkinsus olseni]|uniref:RNA helicase n=1 Tax=Perkinsus olseni TaxID=32597 RepID=A0A7J6RYP6_PEROL|nr:hypothetical protein FOZ62_000531 [Perkinsus olseni]